MEILKRNWKIKLISFSLAIFFWSFVIVLENPNVTTRVSNIPIVIENIDSLDSKGLSIADLSKKTVDINISGKRNNLIKVTPQHIRVTANLKDLDEGNHSIRLAYSLPDEISKVDGPESIYVNLEKIISSDFVINVSHKGTIPPEYILESTKVTPEKVTVKGLRSMINKLKSVDAVLDVSSLTKSTTLNQEIKAFGEDGSEIKGVTLGQNFVNINTVIKKVKEVDIHPIVVGTPSKDYRVEVSLNRSKLYIAGPESIIDNIEKIDTHEIDLSNITTSQKIPVKLSLPSDITQLNDSLSYTLDVEVHTKSVKEFSFDKSVIKVNSYSKKFNILNEDIKLYLRDFSSELDKINIEDIEIRIDLYGISQGTHSIKPKLFYKGGQMNSSYISGVDEVKLEVFN